MFYNPVENAFFGILTIIVFLYITLAFGESFRSIFNIKIINPLLDSIFLSILVTISFGIILNNFNIFNYDSITLLSLIGFFILTISYSYKGFVWYKTLEDLNLKKNVLNSYKERITILKINFHKNWLYSIAWIFLLIYLFLFVLYPAINYPLPLQDDLKHHSIFLKMLVTQETIFPTWKPYTPLSGDVYYQLGGHVYAAFGYTNSLGENIPIPTFMNFWFRISFIVCFFGISSISKIIFDDQPNILLFTGISLLLTPSFYWITRWGGYSWILGFFVFIYVIKISHQIIENRKPELNKIGLLFLNLIFAWSIILIGFIHLNVLFYSILYLFCWLIYFIIVYPKRIPINIISFTFSVSLIIIFILLKFNPDVIFQYIPNDIKFLLTEANLPVTEDQLILSEIFLLNFFIGGFISLFSIFLLFKFRNKEKKLFEFVLVFWIFLLIYCYYILQIDPDYVIRNDLFNFPGAEYMIKSTRLLYFTFIISSIFSALFWIKLRHLLKFSKNLEKLIPITLICLILGFGYLSAYSLDLPNNTSYNEDVLESYEWIIENIPKNSYIFNERFGQWLPLIHDVKITYPFDPIFNNSKSLWNYIIFKDLLLGTISDHYVDPNILLSERFFAQKIDYILISNNVYNDIKWKLGEASYNNIINASIFSLEHYSILNLIHYNNNSAIYEVLWS